MSEKKVTKKTSGKKQVAATRKANGAENPRRKKTGRAVGIIIAIVALLAAVGVGIWFFLSSPKLAEIPTEDETAQELMEVYFYGNHGCYDAKNAILSDGKIDMKTLDYDIKERTIMSYLAYYRYAGLTYAEMNETYHNFFGTDSDLRKKSLYHVTEETFTLSEDGETYDLNTDCAPPEMATCAIIERAYKSEAEVRLTLRVFSRDVNNGIFYAGLDTKSNPLEFTTMDELDSMDLPQWEVMFRYNKDLDRYIITGTRKLS